MRLGRSAVALIAALALSMLVTGCCCVYEVKYNVSGVVVDKDGIGIPGVTISFGDKFGTAETDEDGNWRKIGLYGTVTVIPAKAGFRFEPKTRVVDQNTNESVDFRGIPKPLDLTLHSVLVKEIREDLWLPGCDDDPMYSYGILGIVTNAGGPGDYKIDILGMPYDIDDAPWISIATYGPRPIGAGSADIVISLPASEARYGWLRFMVYGLVESEWVLTDEVTEQVL